MGEKQNFVPHAGRHILTTFAICSLLLQRDFYQHVELNILLVPITVFRIVKG